MCSVVFLSLLLAATSSIPTSRVALQNPLSGLSLRHCSFQLFGTRVDDKSNDFFWQISDPLNGVDGAISIQSVNYPGYYITIISVADETGRLGAVQTPNVDDSSFKMVTGLFGEGSTVLQSLSKGVHAGEYVTLKDSTTGNCASSFSGGQDAILAPLSVVNQSLSSIARAIWQINTNLPTAPPTPVPAAVTVEVTVNSSEITGQINPLSMGCHSDSGYTQEERGFYSQLVIGESFEADDYSMSGWTESIPEGVEAFFAMDKDVTFHGTQSMKMVYFSGSKTAGLINRGLKAEGLYLEASKNYEGYVYITSKDSVEIEFSLEDYFNNSTLGSQTVTAPGDGKWHKVAFNIHLGKNGTTCETLNVTENPVFCAGDTTPSPGHACVRCGGQFKIGLKKPAFINVDYVFLQPGAWGRFNDLPVLKSGVDILQKMGVTVLRQGGSYVSVPQHDTPVGSKDDWYQWQYWTGPRELRNHTVGNQWNTELITGWGIFEMIDMCNAAGIEPAITTTDTSTPESWADLLEYCWGSAKTPMGKKRISDGHPEQYKVKIFELGNEEYNANYVDQVEAMEARATELGLGEQFLYMFPDNGFLNSTDVQKASKLVEKFPYIQSRMVVDLHVGSGGGVGQAQAIFDKFSPFPMGAVNAEVNAGNHDMTRAMTEAADLMEWFNQDMKNLYFRTASFCNERSGHFDGFDQGLSFFLPNATWLQPPGHVHSMIAQTFESQRLSWNSSTSSVFQSQGQVLRYSGKQSNPLSVEIDWEVANNDFSAAKAAKGKGLSAWFVNNDATPKKLHLSLVGDIRLKKHSKVVVQVISAPKSNLAAANTPGNPLAVAPRKYEVLPIMHRGDYTVMQTIPPYSFVAFKLQ